ncbi:MAG TPA: hypothetical protein VK590_09045, partial [Saprospiraceae bacterium]|nr:hypothetical protein [Saprospiraceae bacterium]
KYPEFLSRVSKGYKVPSTTISSDSLSFEMMSDGYAGSRDMMESITNSSTPFRICDCAFSTAVIFYIIKNHNTKI